MFWVVSTYVLTCGWAFPSIAGLAGWALARYLQLDGYRALFITLGFQGVGYVGGMFHALAYIRRDAAIDAPMSCVRPSVVAFLVSAGVGVWANIVNLPAAADPTFQTVAVAAVVVFYAALLPTFVQVTRHGFYAMEKENRRSPAFP